MKKLALISLSFCLLISCRYRTGSGNIITQNRSTGSFSGIDVAGGIEVEVKNGPSEKVVVEADDNLIKYIEVEVVNNELKIRMDKMSIHDAHLKVYVEAPEINNINASAASDVNVKDKLSALQTIRLTASSGSDIKTALDAPEVVANVSSGGELTLSGRTKDLRATGSSGASIHAAELLSENGYIKVSSGADAHVHASVSLDAEASSGGNITYRGAAVVKQSVSSGGGVDKE